MSFPTSPINGQIAVVNNIAYEYATANSSWTRVLSIANIIQANVISANVLNVVQAFSITGNIATANYFIGNGAFLTGLPASYSNTDVANYLPTYTGNLVSLTGPVTTTGNITANNVLFGTGVVSGTGTVYAATVSTTGNVNSGFLSTGPASVGNLISGGFVSATGNVTGGNLSGTNIVGTLTTASQTNITSVGTLGSLTVTANTTSGNLLTGGLVSATGNVTGGNLLTGAQVVASGVIQTGTGFSTGGYLSVDGSTDLHNTTVTGNLSATGNVTGNYILGNGALLTGVITSVANINSGNSNVTVVSSGGNVTVGVAGISNVAVFGADAVTVKGNVLPSANITYDLGTSTQRWKDLWLSNSTIYLGNAQISANATAVTITNPEGGTTVLQGATPSITGAVVSASGNVTGGNLLTAGLISATGNITGGNLSGTSIVGTLTTAAQTNITSVGTLGALTVTANTTSGNLLTSGLISATGNITGGNLRTAGIVSATGNVTGGNLLTAGLISATGNITGGNLRTAGIVSATGNVTGGNVNAGNITIAGDLISSLGATLTIDPATVGNAGLVVINGNLQVNGTTTTINSNVVSTNDLTVNYANNAINASAANGGGIEVGPIGSPYITWLYNSTANVWTSSDGISAVGNTTSGNILTGGVISATGNITGGNLSGTNIVGTLTTASQTNITAVGTLTSVTVTGNTTSGNILTGGLISATGNVASGNLIINSADASIGSVSTTAGWYYESSFSVSAQDSEPRGIFFKPDGTRMYVVGNSGDDILQYDLGTAWNVSTAAYGNSFVVSSQGTSPYDVHFNDDGTIMYVLDGSNDDIDQYTLSSAWDIGSASFASIQFSVSGQESAPTGFWFRPDGTQLFVTGTTGDDVNEYNLGTAWNVSTASFVRVSASLAAYETGLEGLAFSSDGTKMWIVGSTYNRITQFDLSTAWNVSTLSYNSQLPIYGSGPYAVAGSSGLYVNESAGVAYVSDYENDRIFQYDTNTPTGQFYGPQWTTETDFNVGNNLSVNSNLYAGGSSHRFLGTVTVNTSIASPNHATTSSTGTTSLITGTTSGTINFATGITSGTLNQMTAQTTGVYTLGGTGATGAINIGRSTASQSIIIGNGATSSGNTKTISIGQNGVANSITNINIGTATGNGNVTFSANTLVAIANTSGTALSVAGNVQGGNLRTAGLISATGAITGAAITGSSLTVSTGNVSAGNIVNNNANGVGNIGSATTYFNTVFAKATSAQYADLAEMYVADAAYPPGTVLEFGGNHEVTVSNTAASALIAGVVSTNPAHLMNSTAQGDHLAAIALVGRVPTLVVGPVTKGAMMVSAGNGHAQASATPAMGTVIGKAVEDFAGASGTIEIAVGRL